MFWSCSKHSPNMFQSTYDMFWSCSKHSPNMFQSTYDWFPIHRDPFPIRFLQHFWRVATLSQASVIEEGPKALELSDGEQGPKQARPNHPHPASHAARLRYRMGTDSRSFSNHFSNCFHSCSDWFPISCDPFQIRFRLDSCKCLNLCFLLQLLRVTLANHSLA